MTASIACNRTLAVVAVGDDIARVVAGYQPVGIDGGSWSTVAGPVRGWVTDANPGHRRRALHLLHAGAHLAAWCDEQSIPIVASAVLQDATIERFCAIAEADCRFSPSTRSTIRARLRYLAAHQRVPGNRPPAPTVRHAAVRPPYTEAEAALLVVSADTQATALRRTRMRALVHLGLGAGCSPTDLRFIEAGDVSIDGDGTTWVRIRSPLPRRVPVLDPHAEPLRRVASEAPHGLLIGGRPDRRAVTTGLFANADPAHGAPDLDARRLRSTWLVRHLVLRTRLDVLLEIAGLRSLTSIEDLLPHLAQHAGLARPLDAEGRVCTPGATTDRSGT